MYVFRPDGLSLAFVIYVWARIYWSRELTKGTFFVFEYTKAVLPGKIAVINLQVSKFSSHSNRLLKSPNTAAKTSREHYILAFDQQVINPLVDVRVCIIDNNYI